MFGFKDRGGRGEIECLSWLTQYSPFQAENGGDEALVQKHTAAVQVLSLKRAIRHRQTIDPKRVEYM